MEDKKIKQKIIEILKEEIPHQCKIPKSIAEYNHHLDHITKRLLNLVAQA